MFEAPKEQKIWIFRKGNGGAHVHSSPAVVKSRGQLTFHNITDCVATVAFKEEGVMEPTKLDRIPAGEARGMSVKASPVPSYHEYTVVLTECGDRYTQYAEGGSDPGVIIDP